MLKHLTMAQKQRLFYTAHAIFNTVNPKYDTAYLCCILGYAGKELDLDVRELTDAIEAQLKVYPARPTTCSYGSWCGQVFGIRDPARHDTGRKLWLGQITEAVLHDLPFPPPPVP